jgi:hypothetical protein
MTAVRRLHLGGWRAVAVATVALLALLIAAGYAYSRPRRYRAQSTVFVTRVFPADASAVDSDVADFQTVVALAQVRQTVSAKTGVPVSALSSGLSFQRLGGSSALQASFQDTGRARAAQVVTLASQTALATIAQQQLDNAREAVAAAQPAATSALRAVTSFEQSLGVADFTVEYQARQQELLTLENQVANAPPAQAAALDQQLTTEMSAVNRLAGYQPAFERLQGQLTQAQATLDTANTALVDAEGRVGAATSPTVVTPAVATPQSRLRPSVRAGVIAAIVAVVLGIALFAGVDALSGGSGAPLGSGDDAAPQPSGPSFDDVELERHAPV